MNALKVFLVTSFITVFLFCVQLIAAQPREVLVYQYKIKKEIGKATLRTTQKALAEAEQLKADYILLHLSTYGGQVDAADSIRTRLLNTHIPVLVFIDNTAASAGALISLACDSIYMRKGGSIGAATVVNQNGEPMPDKYQSFMRSLMRTTAEAHGKDTIIRNSDTIIQWKRNPLIAEAMVGALHSIPNVVDSGTVLSFTTEEAMKNGFCENEAESVAEVLEKAGIKSYELREYKLTTLESIIGFLLNPILQSILIMLIFAGIYFELQSPGIGFPLVIAITAASLYFAPLYLEGLAANWEILLFVAGVVLLALELFVIPGFGIAGFSGIALIVTGLTLALIDRIVWEPGNISGIFVFFKAFALVIASLFIAFIGSLYLSKVLFTSSRLPNLALHTVQDKTQGYVGVDVSIRTLIGKEGISETVLRPSGTVSIEGVFYDAVAVHGMIDKGVKIKVTKVETAQLYVEPITEA